MTTYLQPQLELLIRQAVFAFLLLIVAGLTFSIAVSSIALVSAATLWIVLLIFSQEKTFHQTPFDYFFLAYVGAELLATAFSIAPAASLFNAKRVLLISVVYLTISSLNTKEKYVWTFGIVVGTSAILSVIEVISLAKIGGHFTRLGIFQHYMTAGGMKMIILLLLVPLAIEKATPLKWRVLSIAACIPLSVAMLLTQTRSSWLGFIAGGVAIGFSKGKKILLALLIIIILVFAFAPQDIRSRAMSIADPTLGSNLSRIHMITTGWRMFLDYPIFGTGNIDLRELYVTYTEPIDPAEGGHLHNNYIMILVTLGAVGFLAVMGLFVKIFLTEQGILKRTRTHWLFGNITLGCLAAYIGFLVSGLFEFNFGDHEIAVFLWFTVGVALVSEKLFSNTLRPTAV